MKKTPPGKTSLVVVGVVVVDISLISRRFVLSSGGVRRFWDVFGCFCRFSEVPRGSRRFSEVVVVVVVIFFLFFLYSVLSRPAEM